MVLFILLKHFDPFWSTQIKELLIKEWNFAKNLDPQNTENMFKTH